jgi:hypothetical protein
MYFSFLIREDLLIAIRYYFIKEKKKIEISKKKYRV